MAAVLPIILIVGVVGGGILLWMNRCNEAVRPLGLCSGNSGQDILDRHNQNPNKQGFLDEGSGPIGAIKKAVTSSSGPKGKPKVLIDSKIKSPIPVGMDKATYNLCCSGSVKKKNALCGRFTDAHCAAFAKKASYSRSNLAVESLSRMSY